MPGFVAGTRYAARSLYSTLGARTHGSRLPNTVLGLAALLAGAGVSAAAEPHSKPAPDPRWSLVYTIDSAEAVGPGSARVQHHSSFVRTPSMAAQDSPDVAVFPSALVTQSENSTFVDPNNSDVIFVSNNATDWPVTQVYGTGVYWSLDGGVTWSGNDFGPGGVANSGDPAAVIRKVDGRWIVGYISTGFGQGVSYSDDQGTTWSHVNLFPSGTLDKNHLMADNSPGSPHYGNVYSAWTAFSGVDVNDIQIVRSTDGGATWPATATNISSGVNAGNHNQGVNVQVGPNGEVYAAWAIYDCWPCNETAIGLNKSTDGGATWTGEFRAITNINGHRNTSLPNTTIRRNSFPTMCVDTSNGPDRGAVYVAWTNQGVPGVNVGDTDIYVAKSADGGATFGSPVRVNQDSTSNAQWLPWIACDPATGVLSAVFYDRRDDPADTMARTYMATSTDGGATWEDFAVGDVSFTPAPIPGLAAGYAGDYLGLAASGGQAYPTWSDNRSGNVLCYVSPILIADPTIPNPPTNVIAFSDYLTPTSAQITWTDATTFPDGTPLIDFSVDILRDSVFVANVNQGIQSYVDSGLVDGQFHEYLLRTHDDLTDSVSVDVPAVVYAGGSPVPGVPGGVTCSSDTVSATINWINPTRQSDGTTLDDFAGIRIYRNGAFVVELVRAPGDTGSADAYVDMPPPGSVYTYELAAIDSESPVNEGARVAAPVCFVGDVPKILVWQPADVVSTSGDSLLSALLALGEGATLTDSLFKYSTDLNVHEMVFACVGVSPGNHVITAAEGAALDSLVQDGGRLYLEGADCFNHDPEANGGYNVRPIFGLADGSTGTADLFGVTGINDLSGVHMAYSGPNVSIDELQPVTATAVFQNDANTDLVSVYEPGYFLGRSIAASFEFGGLVDSTGSSTKSALLAAHLSFFRSPGNPVQSVSPSALAVTLYQDSLATRNVTVSNPGTPNSPLAFTVTESPDVGWLSASPTSGSVNANGTSTITVTYDATGLLPGTFTTNLLVAGNDPANPVDTVAVSLDVLGIPMLDVTPDSVYIAVPLNGARLDSLTITNTGLGDLAYDLVLLGAGGVEREEFNAATNTLTSSSAYRGNVYQIDDGLTITRIDHQLDISAATDLEFFVYEAATTSSQYYKKFSTTLTSGTGLAWYSSGPIEVRLDPGKFYYIGCAWQGGVVTYRDDAQNMPQPVAFGTVVSSGGSSGYPAPDSTTVSAAGQIIWDQGIEYGYPVDVGFATAAAGTLSSGASAVTVLDVGGSNTLGTFRGILNIHHSIAGQPRTFALPVTVEISDAPVDAAAVEPALPRTVALHRPAPNPFRSGTVIRYDLPRSEAVLLEIYDVAGRRIRTLADGVEKAGFRSVVWDGRSQSGNRVASGIYFYALRVGDAVYRQKAVVLH